MEETWELARLSLMEGRHAEAVARRAGILGRARREDWPLPGWTFPCLLPTTSPTQGTGLAGWKEDFPGLTSPPSQAGEAALGAVVWLAILWKQKTMAGGSMICLPSLLNAGGRETSLFFQLPPREDLRGLPCNGEGQDCSWGAYPPLPNCLGDTLPCLPSLWTRPRQTRAGHF